MNLSSLEDLDDGQLEQVLETAEVYANNPRGHTHVLDGRIVCTAFFEPSTRTRLSFEAAAHRLGARVIGFSDASSTSSAKGETLEDTARVLGGYADLLVIRHPETGSAARAAAATDVPVVNAGDGSGQHPSQTLVDLFTIRQTMPLASAKVAVLGDLRYGRTVHSLVPALRRFGADVVQIPAPGFELPPDLDVPVAILEDAMAHCNVLYATRMQAERFPDAAAHEAAQTAGRLDREALTRAGFSGIVLHPLPRVDELSADIDDLPAAKYFDQARNGVAVRMALLDMLLEETQ